MRISGFVVEGDDAVFGGGIILVHKKGEYLWTLGVNSREHNMGEFSWTLVDIF